MTRQTLKTNNEARTKESSLLLLSAAHSPYIDSQEELTLASLHTHTVGVCLHNSHSLLPKCAKRSFNVLLAPCPQTRSHSWHSESADSAWVVASAPQGEQANHVAHSSLGGMRWNGIMRCSCRGDTFEPNRALVASDPDLSRCPPRSDDDVCVCVWACTHVSPWLAWRLALNL